MTTRLSRTDSLDSGDLIVLYKGNDSDFRGINVPDFIAKVQDGISNTEVLSYYLRLDKDETLDLSENRLSMWVKVLNSSPSKTLTVALPSASWAEDGQEVLVNNLSSNPITVDLSSAGASVIGGQVSVLPNLEARFTYDKTLRQWFRSLFVVGSVTTVVGKEGDVTALDISTALLADTNLMLSTNLETPSGLNQQLVNDTIGGPWYNKVGGYSLNERVTLTNGNIVRSTANNNTINPNLSMTGWVPANLDPSSNLSDVPSKSTARTNLDVYSKTETNTAISDAETPAATELIAGKAKIATTEIAKMGVNDTDIITAKKLNDVLDFTYVNKTSTRQINTIYTNGNSVRRINLTSQAMSNGIRALRVRITKSGLQNILTINVASSSGGYIVGGNVEIPPNATYEVFITVPTDLVPTSETIATWLEGEYA